MPTTKEAQRTDDPIDVVLKRAALLLDHPALKNRAEPDPHAAIVAEIHEELRTLEARLTAYDPAMVTDLKTWCKDKDSLKRLDNISSTLEALQMITVDTIAKNHSAQATERKWHLLDDATRHQLILSHCIHNQRTEKYDKPFINFLQLGTFVQQQKRTAEAIKRLQSAKDLASSAINVAGRMKGVISTAKHLSVAVDHGARTAEGLSTGAHAATAAAPLMTSVLQAIPIASAAVTAAKALYDLGHSFIKKRGASDKVANGIMLGVSAAAIALTIVFPVAAAGIAAGLVAAGVVRDYIKPYFDMRKQIKQRESAIVSLDERINTLNNPDVTLNETEKNILIRQVENYFIESKDTKLTDLKAAKEAIRQGDPNKLNQDPLLKLALNLSQEKSVEQHLQQQHQTKQSDIKREITGMNKERNTKLGQAINGFFTIAGAAMLAIPFPPVMIAGAAILLASSIAGIAIKYREQIGKAFTSMKNGLKNLFGAGRSDHEVTKEAPQPEAPSFTPVAPKQAEVSRITIEPTPTQVLLEKDNRAEEPKSSSPRVK